MVSTVTSYDRLKYFKTMEHDCTAFTFVESLTRSQVWLEQIMLGMRSAKGVNINELLQNLTEIEVREFNTQLAVLQEAGFILVQQGRLYLKPKGLSVENEVVVRLSI